MFFSCLLLDSATGILGIGSSAPSVHSLELQYQASPQVCNGWHVALVAIKIGHRHLQFCVLNNMSLTGSNSFFTKQVLGVSSLCMTLESTRGSRSENLSI